MPIVEGSHPQGTAGSAVGYHVEYEVVGNAVHYKATFRNGSAESTHEGQFDFDPARLDAAQAVDAFMANHIGKADFDSAP